MLTFRFGEKVDKPDASFLGIVQTKNRPPHYVLQVTKDFKNSNNCSYVWHSI
jgi:hypothetical protein